jgi:hypothetical protein
MKSGGNYATALRKLIAVLRKIDPVFDSAAIEYLAGECSKIPAKSTDWAFNLKKLSFPIITFKEAGLDHVRPRHVSSKKYRAILSVEASGKLLLAEHEDSMQHLAVNIVITEWSGIEAGPIFCAWHLDSHPPPPKRNEATEGPKEKKNIKKDDDNSKKEKESSFAHPRYHWQYGGKKVWEAGEDNFFGSHLLLESPRLPHPPLDVILAIDFVFANYYGKQWRKLRAETEYQRIIQDAQQRYWLPYYNAIHNNWAKRPEGTAIKLMPSFY